MMTKLSAALFLASVGCASATDGDFHVSGRLVDSGHVTDIVATSPIDGKRVVAPVTSDDFEIALTPGKQWVVTFAEATKVGRDMQVATLQTGTMDALVPQGAGSLDLGSVKFLDGRAHGTADMSDVLDALGLDNAPAARMGLMDDLALRVANPDIDNDGIIDVVAPRLEVSGTYKLTQNGSDLAISTLVGSYDHVALSYESTTLAVAVPRAMNMAMETGTVMFDSPFYGTALGPQTPMIQGGTRIGQPHTKFGSLDGENLIGLVARPGFDAPRGTYELGFANGELTFTDVYPPTAPVLESAQSYAVPMVHIAPTDAKCSGNCFIDAISLDWKSLTASGWQSAATRGAHLDIVLQRAGKKTYLAADMDGAKLVWNTIDVRNTGITWNELSYFTTQNICYIGVSYESELGMKMTNAHRNPGCF